ncbi:ATP-binding protein [Anaerovorax odorimutans]|uniref:ATP-binding protein n=1 Tax=Anaerovorax odorimutans TaxID=109327 RepID=UPI000408F187|nr:DUF4143 domain-containing protein [Anaerovorax odorimutans]
MNIKRNIESTIRNINNNYSVLMLTGAKGTGRRTLLKMLEDDGRKYFSFDDKELRNIVIENPDVFFECIKPPVAIIGIQYALNLMPYINQYCAKNNNNGDFWLVATHMCDLFDNVGRTMGDNVGIAHMMGLTYEEITGETLDLFNIDIVEENEINVQILRGSMPALYGEGIDNSRDKYFDEYMQEFLREEIRGMTTVTDIILFRKFMISAAKRSGELVNYAVLAKDVGISQPTAKKWLSLLVSAGIIGLIQPFSHPKLTRIIDVPRMYFMDTGLCSYLAEIKKPEKLFKTWVVAEMIKRYYNKGIKPPFYHYRDKDGKEVDLIIEEDSQLQPIEIIDLGKKVKDRAKKFNGFARKNIAVNDWKIITVNEIL